MRRAWSFAFVERVKSELGIKIMHREVTEVDGNVYVEGTERSLPERFKALIHSVGDPWQLMWQGDISNQGVFSIRCPLAREASVS
jgi:hypothetical protein